MQRCTKQLLENYVHEDIEQVDDPKIIEKLNNKLKKLYGLLKPLNMMVKQFDNIQIQIEDEISKKRKRSYEKRRKEYTKPVVTFSLPGSPKTSRSLSPAQKSDYKRSKGTTETRSYEVEVDYSPNY